MKSPHIGKVLLFSIRQNRQYTNIKGSVSKTLPSKKKNMENNNKALDHSGAF